MTPKNAGFCLALAVLFLPGRAAAEDAKAPPPLPAANDYEKTQRPPLEASSTTVCHIAEAKPLLLKARYNVIQYQRRAISDKPLVIQEKLRLTGELAMTIESRGCEDIYSRFEFFIKDATSTAKQWLDPAAEALRGLHLNSDSLVSGRSVAAIANAVAIESNAKHETLEFDPVSVCLSRGKKECLADVSIELKPPKLTAFYIDRP